jgi:radical SAM protein with 4Fe4S-binding SPASM domain
MDEDLFYKIADEVVGIDLIETIMFHGLNEPLLDKRLETFVAYYRDKKPMQYRNIFTNGMFLTPERFDALKEAGLTSCVISLNANSQEQHEQIMGVKGMFLQTVRNIVHAINNRGDAMAVEVHTVVNHDTFTKDDAIEFTKRWGQARGDGYGLTVVEANWAGQNRQIYQFDKSKGCDRALGSVYVMYDGRVTTCCQDPFGHNVFGDLNTQTLREIYASKMFTQFRKDHFEDKADRWEICRNCTRI